MSLREILEQVESYQVRHVCLTGGEPLLQKNSLTLMKELCNRGHLVSLETSGAKSCKDVDLRVKIILDVKTPDSGELDSFDGSNLLTPLAQTEFKFVICSEKDFLWAEKFVAENLENRIVLYSPAYNQVTPQWLAEKILSSKSKARLQLQMHKFIWPPDKRGV